MSPREWERLQIQDGQVQKVRQRIVELLRTLPRAETSAFLREKHD